MKTAASKCLVVWLTLAMVALPGCLMPRYLAQASYGQFDLLRRARPIEKVIADPNTPEWVANLLAEIPSIKAYGAAQGLLVKRNYTTYSALGRTAAVWFVGAADPLAFRPRKWCFPIVGCFPGLGWFDEDDAIAHRRELEARGYDAISRPASAYSTGGWFPDPVLSTMLSSATDGFPEFANVILHESVHASVLVPDQPFFNESIASYVADAMTDHWVVERFGAGSPEQLAWLYGQASREVRTARMFATYAELDVLYKSDKTRTDKLAAKARIIDELVDEMRLRRRPNNASLIELRVYKAGASALADAHRGCGDLRRMVMAARQLKRSDFGKDLEDDLSAVVPKLIARCKTMTQ
ncbi:MAG TPA: aminopeptidase [Kofleriaceae bacterium]|nr:aminopeptidase [Kofleriaceae bacterium]